MNIFNQIYDLICKKCGKEFQSKNFMVKVCIECSIKQYEENNQFSKGIRSGDWTDSGNKPEKSNL